MGVTAAIRREHRYQTCQDEDCKRFACRVYKEGRRDGREQGRREGYDEGYSEGFDKGLASCPGPHGGR